MNQSVGSPTIGQWYARTDNGSLFQVVGRDENSRAIEIQSFDGDLDEIDAEAWCALPIERTEPPEDSNAPLDDVGQDETGDGDTHPVESVIAQSEAWEEVQPEDDGDPLDESTSAELYAQEVEALNGPAEL